MHKKVAKLAARALRAAANRIDPEPPHMESALRLLGWRYDGSHWFYCPLQTWSTSGTGNTNSVPPYGTIEWRMGTGEDS